MRAARAPTAAKAAVAPAVPPAPPAARRPTPPSAAVGTNAAVPLAQAHSAASTLVARAAHLPSSNALGPPPTGPLARDRRALARAIGLRAPRATSVNLRSSTAVARNNNRPAAPPSSFLRAGSLEAVQTALALGKEAEGGSLLARWPRRVVVPRLKRQHLLPFTPAAAASACGWQGRRLLLGSKQREGACCTVLEPRGRVQSLRLLLRLGSKQKEGACCTVSGASRPFSESALALARGKQAQGGSLLHGGRGV